MADKTSLGKLIVEIGANLDDLQKGLKDANDQVKDFDKKTSVSVANIAKGFAFVGAAIVGALAGAVAQTVKYSDEIFKASQRTGIATETLSKLKFVADQTESSFEEVSGGLKILSKNIFEAENGNNKLKKSFEELGIKTRDASGNLITVDNALLQIADKFTKITDPTLKSALAMQFFGKNGQALVPILNLGSEGIAKLSKRAEELGLVLSQENAKAIDEFDDNLKQFKAAVGGAALALGQFFIPALTELIKFITEKAIPVIEALNAALIKTGKVLSEERTTQAFAGLPGDEESKQVIANLEKIANLQKAIQTGGGRGSSGQEAEVKRLLEENKRLQAEIVEKRRESVEVTKEEKVAQEEVNVAVSKVDQLINDIGLKQGESVDQFRANLEEFKSQIAQLNDEQILQLTTRLEEEKLLTKTAEEAKTDIVKTEVARRTEEAKKIGDQIITFGKTIESSFSGALSGLISGTKSASEAAKELGQSLVKAIADFIAQRLVALTIGKAIQALEVALAKITGGALASAYVEAATLASIATFGGAAVAGTGAVVSALATTKSLVAGFAEGADKIPARLAPGEMVVPATFADAIRKGRLTLGGPDGGPAQQPSQIVFENINIRVEGSLDQDAIPEIMDQIGLQTESRLRGAR